MSDNTDIENNVPLEKTKTIKPVKEVIPEVQPPTKPKKPRTDKQKTQFQQVMTKRQENIEKKKLEKKIEASKLLVEKDPEFLKQLKEPLTPTFEQVGKIRNKKIVESESESDESVIIIKRKPKPKKKKTIIIEESESSSSSDEEVIQLPKPKSERKFITQQNKKSVIKIHNKPSTPSYENYFV